MTFQKAVDCATTRLSSFCDSAKLDAQLLVCRACGVTQTKLVANPETDLSEDEVTLFRSLLMRRSRGEPLAYITGKKEFWSLDFIVNEHVLIPRPETELLVETTLAIIADKNKPRVLDLGTGSGCIAIAIAKERNDCSVVATDVSASSLQVAKLNATELDVEITFIHSNWYENLHYEKFDVIVCNPPYIAADDPNLDRQATAFEPDDALISKKDGLYSLEQVISGARRHLHPHGYLIVEHGFQQAEAVRELLKLHQFNRVQTYKDLAKLERATKGQISI